MNNLKYVWKVMKKGFAGFDGDNCFRYAAALSFYTLFSIAPIVMISIHAASFFAQDIDFQQEMSNQFERLVGEQGAQGVEVLMESLQDEKRSTFQLVIGVIILLFSATNIFIQLQGAFNDIYNVRPKQGKAIVKQVIDRLTSLGMILSLGFILIISLVLDSIIVSLKGYLSRIFEDATVVLITITENLIMLGIMIGVVYALFHFLPDVRIKKKFKLKGSTLIAVLLLIGKFGISWYIGNSRFSELGGASASIIILMLWVYYSSLILFLGAEMIKGMAKVSNVYLPASHYAVRVKSVTVDEETGEEKKS